MSDRDGDGKPLAQASGALAELSDDILVERARRKDEAAFEELVGRYEEKLYRLAMRFVRNETDAQEILQEAFLSAWRNLPTFEGRAQFGSWMYRVTANAALMLLRGRNRHPEVGVDDVEPHALEDAVAESGQTARGNSDWAGRADEQLHSQQLRQHIQASVDRLPDGLRTVFLLRDVEELSTEDTAELLGLSVPAVKTRLHRARLILREAIGRHFA
ncbi:MAG: sigma-70 family RNA polymerase sigma factor [Deltaproteobacteria bacterium]|jgi:RNA polymerase sigma-70 factor (ECF subfamily)|nr:sigma-70 family RNA polymerase sigma factor [Deltaproteobacteria bacterium]